MMALINEFKDTGNWLFKYRSFLPLIIIPFLFYCLLTPLETCIQKSLLYTGIFVISLLYSKHKFKKNLPSFIPLFLFILLNFIIFSTLIKWNLMDGISKPQGKILLIRFIFLVIHLQKSPV